MEYERVSELRRNTVIISISNICSKGIVFILSPLYSFFLSPEQYGTMDLITTTVGLLVPFICCDIFEATFRFSSDQNYDEEKVLCSSLAVTSVGSAVAICLLILLSLIGQANRYIVYSGIVIILESFNSVLKQFARGRSKMKVFAFSGVLEAVTLLAANLIFLVLLKYKLDGWLIAYVLCKGITSLYLIISTNSFRIFSIHKIDRTYISRFIRFCVPLIPTATMWWVMNASDRYLISFFLGKAANGVYAVANKLPAFLSIFESVFYQAWQTTAIKLLDDKNRDEIYSSILTKYIVLLCIGTLSLLVVVKPMVFLFFAPEYADAWKCLPILLIGIVFHAIGGNLGSLYTVFKSTKGAFVSTIIGAVSNILLNFAVIPSFGIIGAAITTLLGYIATCVYRWFDVQKFVRLKVEQRKLIPIYIFLPISLVMYYWSSPISYGIRAAIAASLLIVNYKLIFSLIRKR